MVSPADIFSYSQIIQGVLILLSSLVAVAGYFVQSKMKLKERQREQEMQHREYLRKMKLERLREQMDVFLGPMSVLSNDTTRPRTCTSGRPSREQTLATSPRRRGPSDSVGILGARARVCVRGTTPAAEAGPWR